MKNPERSSLRFWVVFVLKTVIDQVSKVIVHRFLTSSVEIFPGWLFFDLRFNTGSAWSFFAGSANILAWIGIFVLAIMLICRKKFWGNNCFVGGMICGGILGNTIDRLVYGYVIDFIDVDLQCYRWPTFNIADIAINLGLLYLVFGSLYASKKN